MKRNEPGALTMRIHHVGGKAAGAFRVGVYLQILLAPPVARQIGPIEIAVQFEGARFGTRRSELRCAPFQERRPQRYMLRPGTGAVPGGQVFDSLVETD